MSRSVLVGLIGSAIQASRSPALHEREAAEHGLRYIYKLIDLDVLGLTNAALGELLTAAERLGFAGVNVTHPSKQAVLPHLDELAETAAAVGAVNTVVFTAGKRIGHNTDCSGFAESFRRGMPDVAMGRVVQIGAGGAGAAVSDAALSSGVGELILVDIDGERAGNLATRLNQRHGAGKARVGADAARELATCDGLINATPIGMAAHPGTPVPLSLLRPEMWVADIVYFPLETELLRAARRLGCRTMGGGGMAVFQAAEAFRLFTGITPDVDRMLRHFETF